MLELLAEVTTTLGPVDRKHNRTFLLLKKLAITNTVNEREYSIMDYFSNQTVFIMGIIIGIALTIAFEITVTELLRK